MIRTKIPSTLLSSFDGTGAPELIWNPDSVEKLFMAWVYLILI